MTDHKDGNDGEEETLQLHARRHYHKRKRHQRHHPGINGNEHAGTRIADMKVGSDIGKKSDGHKFGGIKHKDSEGQPYQGQPSLISTLKKIRNFVR